MRWYLMNSRYRVQADVVGKPQVINTFHMEMLQQKDLIVFGFMQPKDMTIYLLHSPAPFYARGATTALKGKNIGLVGNCMDFSNPAPVILQLECPCKCWLTKDIVTNENAIDYFYANPSNEGKFLTPNPMPPSLK
jgi:hypothetical protein